MGFYGFGRDIQLGGNLARGVIQADQRGDLLLAWGEALPALPVFPLGLVVAKRISQDLGGNLFRGALFMLGKEFERAQGIDIQGKICVLLAREPTPDRVNNPLEEYHKIIL